MEAELGELKERLAFRGRGKMGGRRGLEGPDDRAIRP